MNFFARLNGADMLLLLQEVDEGDRDGRGGREFADQTAIRTVPRRVVRLLILLLRRVAVAVMVMCAPFVRVGCCFNRTAPGVATRGNGVKAAGAEQRDRGIKREQCHAGRA